jgi:NAD(P)-dependent dehydrogenase (short-subunit alcohol dehydrogenase family)
MSTRTALVTGAGRDTGRAIAVRLDRSGWRVHGGVRTEVAAKELAAESRWITPVELDPEPRSLYAPHFAGERQLVGKIRKNAKPPEQVAAAVERRLTRRRMRPRTLVRADARTILGWKALLPARRLDAVWTRGIGG